MTRIAARTFSDFARAVRVNMKIDARGRAVLSSNNEAPNPRFTEFADDGSPDGYAPFYVRPGPRGKNIYVAPRGGRLTKQNFEAVPLGRSTYIQDDALFFGDDLPGDGALAWAPRPGRPRVMARADDVAGYPEGEYATFFCYVTGNARVMSKRYFTNPSPDSPSFRLEEGQWIEQPLPERVPDGISGVVVGLRLPDGRRRMQRTIPVGSYLPRSVRMRGPLSTAYTPPAGNNTFVGPARVYRHLDWRFQSAQWNLRELLSFKASWQFEAGIGWSGCQGIAGFQFVGGNCRLGVYLHPPVRPRNARRWRVVLMLQDGSYYAVDPGIPGSADGALPFGRSIVVYTSNPSEWPPGSNLVSVSDGFTTVDTTGVEGPESALDAPGIFGEARIEPGPYTVRITDDYEDGESRPSPPASINVPAGRILDIRLADDPYDDGNQLTNATLEERDVSGNPLGWTYPEPQKVADSPGEISVSETVSRSEIVPYARSEAHTVDPEQPICTRFLVRSTRHVSGNLGVRLVFYTTAGTFISAVLVARSSEDALFERTVGKAGSGVDIEWPSNTGQLIWEIVGYPADGSFEMDGSVAGMGFWKGRHAPALRPTDATGAGEGDLLGPAPSVEDTSRPYPSGPYVCVVEGYLEEGHNAAEYYAPQGTTPNRQEFLRRLRVPLEASETMCVSVDVEADGVDLEEDYELYGGVVRDQSGEIVADTPPVILSPDGFGRVRGRLSVAWDSPEARGCVWESIGAYAGGGRIRVWKVQVERSPAPTAFDDSHAPEGTITQTFDSWVPGAPLDDDFGMLSAVKRVVSLYPNVEEPEGTSVSTKVRFKSREEGEYSDWITDPATITAFDLRRFVEVEVAAKTERIEVTPRIAEIGMTVEREMAVLLRADGSEYYGGLHVYHMPTRTPTENEEERVNILGQRGFRELYPATGELKGLAIHGYDRLGVEEAALDSSRGERLFQIAYRGDYWTVRILSLEFAYDVRENEEGKSVHVAETTAEIIDVRAMA